MKITDWVKDNASTILTCFGAAGMVTTVIFAVRATPKAQYHYVDAQVEKNVKSGKVTVKKENLPKLNAIEVIRACGRDYFPTVVTGTITLGCIFAANTVDVKQRKRILAEYLALSGAYANYRNKIYSICGPEANIAATKAVEQEQKDILEDRPPWDAVQTFYIECQGESRFFDTTMERVIKAEYEANRYFRLAGGLTFNHFLEQLGVEPFKCGNENGWDDYIGDIAYGYHWIDFNHRYFETDDGLTVCAIDMPFAPHSLKDEELFE